MTAAPPVRSSPASSTAVVAGTPSVSAVMVTYHTGPVLRQAITAVLRQPELHELIIVDNGNPPDIRDALVDLARTDRRVSVLSGQGNIGFAAACNRAADRASGDYLLLLNPDCLLPDGALAALMAEHVRVPRRPAIVGCRIDYPDGTEQRGSRRQLLTPWLAVVEAFRLDRLAPNHPRLRRLNDHETAPPEHPTAVPAISGALMLMATADYRSLGGMDEAYFLHVEDLDLCFRANAAGGTVLFVPQVAVTHLRSTSNAWAARVEWHKSRGLIRYFRKHFSGTHPKALLHLLSATILLRFGLKSLVGLVPGALKALSGRPGPHRPGCRLNLYRPASSGRKGRADR